MYGSSDTARVTVAKYTASSYGSLNKIVVFANSVSQV